LSMVVMRLLITSAIIQQSDPFHSWALTKLENIFIKEPQLPIKGVKSIW